MEEPAKKTEKGWPEGTKENQGSNVTVAQRGKCVEQEGQTVRSEREPFIGFGDWKVIGELDKGNASVLG